MVPIEISPKDTSPRVIRRRKASAGLASPRRPHIKPSQFVRPDAHFTLPRQIQRPENLSQSPSRGARVANRSLKLPPPTDFEYVGSIEASGWKPGQVPLFLEWYPENLDRRSVCKFFESGREYTMGRSPACDFYFPNCEYDSGISGNHLTIKVPEQPNLQSWTMLIHRQLWFVVNSIEFMSRSLTTLRMGHTLITFESLKTKPINYHLVTMSLSSNETMQLTRVRILDSVLSWLCKYLNLINTILSPEMQLLDGELLDPSLKRKV